MISNGVHVIIYIESFKHPFFHSTHSVEKKKKKCENFFIAYIYFCLIDAKRRDQTLLFLHRIKIISENENML